MCLICVEFEKKKLSWEEAYKNYCELDPKEKHTQEVLDMLNDYLYTESLESTGSDYREINAKGNNNMDPDLWYDDYLSWSDYLS